MLTVMIRNGKGTETIHGGVREVTAIRLAADRPAGSPPAGIHIRFFSGDGIHLDWTIGKRSPADEAFSKVFGPPEVFVMNDDGKTTARYRY